MIKAQHDPVIIQTPQSEIDPQAQITLKIILVALPMPVRRRTSRTDTISRSDTSRSPVDLAAQAIFILPAAAVLVAMGLEIEYRRQQPPISFMRWSNQE